MTVKLLVDWKDPSTGRQYRIGNLLDTDDYTEAGLIASKQAQADLTGGTAQTDPVVNHGDGQVVRANPAGTALRMGDYEVPIAGIPCEAFGASPSATADVNTAAIQAALNAAGQYGGRVTLYTPGTYLINRTLRISSNTSFVCIGVLKLASASNCVMLANQYAQSIVDIEGATISGGYITVPELGHQRVNGDEVYVEGMVGNSTLNGKKTVVNSIPGLSWQYAATGANPTNGDQQRIYVVRYKGLAGSNFVRADNVVTVTEVGHTRRAGDHLYIAALSGTSSFNGMLEIKSCAGDTWTYANTGVNETATGTALLLGDHNIELDINGMDHNKAGQTKLDDQTIFYTCHLVNISRVYAIMHNMTGGYGRYWQGFNASDITVPLIRSDGGRCCVQYDSACTRITHGSIIARNNTDDTFAVGVTGNLNSNNSFTASPSGVGNMGIFIVDYIDSDSPTGTLKVYGTTGYSIDSIEIGTIVGAGRVSLGDQNGIDVSGIAVGTVKIGALRNHTAAGLALSHNGGISSFKLLEVGIPGFLGPQSNVGYLTFDPAAEAQTLETLVIRNSKMWGGVQYSQFIKVSNAMTINRIILNNVEFVGHDGTNYYSTLLGLLGGGNVIELFLDNVICKDARALVEGSATSAAMTVYANNVKVERCAYGFYNGGGMSITLNFNNFVCPSVNSPLLYCSGGGTSRMAGKNLTHPTGKAISLTTSGPSMSIDCEDAQVDLGTATNLSPQAGDRVWNTNAGYGAGVGMYGYTAAGAWQKMF